MTLADLAIKAKEKLFIITVEETKPPTHNINMHSFHTFAISKEEAVGKMYFERKDLINRPIINIKSL